jgi:hypothetical protein
MSWWEPTTACAAEARVCGNRRATVTTLVDPCFISMHTSFLNIVEAYRYRMLPMCYPTLGMKACVEVYWKGRRKVANVAMPNATYNANMDLHRSSRRSTEPRMSCLVSKSLPCVTLSIDDGTALTLTTLKDHQSLHSTLVDRGINSRVIQSNENKSGWLFRKCLRQASWLLKVFSYTPERHAEQEQPQKLLSCVCRLCFDLQTAFLTALQ